MRLKGANKERIMLLLFVLPSLLGLLVFYAVPFVISFFYTLIDNNILRNFVGLQNFKDLLTNGAFLLGLKNTGVFMASCVPLNVLFPLAMALLLGNVRKLKNVFFLIFLLPLVIPSGSVSYFWKSILGLNGIINGAFYTDAPVNWLNTDTTRILITLVFIWKNAGYNMILFFAGLKSIPQEYHEYASIEGAGRVQRFFHITLVYLTPTMFLVFIMSIINSFKAFKEIFLLCGAYPHTSVYMLQHFMNNQFTAMNYQKLTTASYILSIFIVVLVLILYRLQNRRASSL